MRSLPDVTALRGKIVAMRRGVLRQIDALTGRHLLHKRLFLGEDGLPGPDGAEFLRDLAAFAFTDRPSPTAAGLSLERIEGRRDVYFRMTRALRLDGEKLVTLHERLREIDDE